MLPIAALLAACPPPGGGGKPADITPTTYTTTVSGKVTTPAGNAVTQYDTATRRSIPSAEDAAVWASTDPAAKVAVASDGSYTLSVTHPGTFTLNVDYPAEHDYKAGAPQTVTTTATAHKQNIALSYGHTTTLSGQVSDNPSGTTYINRNELPVIVYVENREVARTTSRTIGGIVGSYRITFDHPGTFRATASFESRTGAYSRARHIGAISGGVIILRP